MKSFFIWRKQPGQTEWINTGQLVRARTPDEAQSKVKTKFRAAGFHSMSLAAVESGSNPNDIRLT